MRARGSGIGAAPAGRAHRAAAAVELVGACLVAAAVAVGGPGGAGLLGAAAERGRTAASPASVAETRPQTRAGGPQSGPQHVITMAPNLTEIVFALGAGDRLVAVSDYSDYPPEAKKLPRAGGFIDPDVEQVLAHRPDLVILREYSRSLERSLAAFHVPVLRVRDEAIGDVLEAIRDIGRALGLGPRADSLAASIEREVDSYRRRPEPAHRPRVLLVAGRSPGTLQDLYSPGAGTFLDEMIHLAGGANLFADSRVPYLKVSKEEIIARDPEVIVEPVAATSYAGSSPELDTWRVLGPVSAVRAGRIRVLEGDYLLIPGPRLVQALRDLERAIQTP